MRELQDIVAQPQARTGLLILQMHLYTRLHEARWKYSHGSGDGQCGGSRCYIHTTNLDGMLTVLRGRQMPDALVPPWGIVTHRKGLGALIVRRANRVMALKTRIRRVFLILVPQ